MKNKNLKNSIALTALVVAVLTLSGCSTMSLSKEQCLSGDWKSIGYNDGVSGRYPSRISEHQQACAEAGIIPNYKSWEDGRKQGLVHYCTETNARRMGMSGKSFNAVCPAKKVSRLQSVHNKAYTHYKRQREIYRDKRRLEKYRNELAELKDGGMLNFKTEARAREYMLKIQKETTILERRIRKNERAN